MSVYDYGAGFAGAQPMPDPLAESGRGLHLVRELADDLTIEGNAHGGTTVRVRWHGGTDRRAARTCYGREST